MTLVSLCGTHADKVEEIIKPAMALSEPELNVTTLGGVWKVNRQRREQNSDTK